jgi:hypothetical protein
VDWTEEMIESWTQTAKIVLFRRGPLLAPPILALGLVLLLSTGAARAASEHPSSPVVDGSGDVNPATLDLDRDPRVAELLTRITSGTLLAYERKLTGAEAVEIGGETYTITTRYSYSVEQISKATQYVYEKFAELGLDVAFHPYDFGGDERRNVVAERRGAHRPDEIYLISAHLDDLPIGPVAPGADDNGSGTTAVLIAADLLRRIDFDCTLRFVLFTGEEQGLIGSGAYAADIAYAGDDVRGVLNLDMIGYNSAEEPDPTLDLHVNSSVAGSLGIAEDFSQVVAAYELDLKPEILVDNNLGNFSDNRSFWDHGYPAILAIEDADDFSKYWHTVSDTVETLDPDYFTEFVRAGVGTFAHLGCRSMGSLAGTVTASDTGAPVAAMVTAFVSKSVYETSAGVDGQYALDLPVYTYTVRASRPGYFPATITEVVALTDATVVQHFLLEPWPVRMFVPLLIKGPGS